MDLRDLEVNLLDKLLKVLLGLVEAPGEVLLQVLTDFLNFLRVIDSFGRVGEGWQCLNDVLLLFVQLVDVDKVFVITHEGNLLLESGLNLRLVHFTEGLTHDGNEHVHENYGHEEVAKQEHWPNQILVWWFLEVFREQFANTDEVDTDKGINESESGVRVHVWLLLSLFVRQIAAANEEDCDEGRHDDCNDEHEPLQVRNRFHYQLNEVRGLAEESQPVKHLDPKEKQGHASASSNKGRFVDLLPFNQVGHELDHVDLRYQGYRSVKVVPHIFKVHQTISLQLPKFLN